MSALLNELGKLIPQTDPTVKQNEPYKVFATKEDLTDYIKVKVKAQKETAIEPAIAPKNVNEPKKDEALELINELSTKLNKMKTEKELDEFNDDVKEIILEKLDYSKDVKEQLNEFKKKFPTFVKREEIAISNKPKPTGNEDNEKFVEKDGFKIF